MNQVKSKKIIRIIKLICYGFIVLITTPISEIFLSGYYYGKHKTKQLYETSKPPRRFLNPLKLSSKKDVNNYYNSMNEVEI